jgi:pimeloyl-ACP methyl ester carboxylesterase
MMFRSLCRMLAAVAVAIIAILGLGAAITVIGVAQINRANQPDGSFVPVTGGRLHVVDLASAKADDGPPIVLLHGASGNLEDQRLTLGNKLAASHRVILIDRPGHGFSDRPDGAADASPARQAALIAEALERLGVKRAIIVGHSLAGAVATAFALDFPERTAGLVLLAPVTHPWKGGIYWYNKIASTPVLGPLFTHSLVVPLGFFLLTPGIDNAFAPEQPPADYARRAAAALVLRPDEFVANAQDLAVLKTFVTAQVPRYHLITAPTVVITGDRDTTVWPDIHARPVAALIPGAKLIVLKGIGHMLPHVAPEVIVAEIDGLTAKLRSAPAASLNPR